MRLLRLLLLTLGLAGAGTATAQPFTLLRFPIGEPGVTAYTAPMIAVLDHSGTFYTNCCDSEVVAYTGERALREDGALGCGDDTFPACFFGLCICAYANPTGEPWTVTGSYIRSFGGSSYLLYDGHAGYDYSYGFGTPLVAPRAGRLCKARVDYVNGSFGFSSAWAKFHTYYIDHGVFDGVGYATWHLHASDLETPELQELGVGLCADVTEGQIVARVGNQGTFAPHLHFEARTYDPAEGPEGSSSRVIDPYGWTGQDPDPWENEAENPQAAHRALPLWEDEKCSPFGPVECGACEQCDFALECVVAPATECKVAEAGSLTLRDAADDRRDRLQWRWRKGAATESPEFGDPTT
ncbi:MAG: M23 family metallopeptidase, partial [Myxococcales bacterium]|nr:M23 family metallopeptidase [Myxococcales bacterium]